MIFLGCPHDLGKPHMIKWISWGSKASTVGDQLKTSFSLGTPKNGLHSLCIYIYNVIL